MIETSKKIMPHKKEKIKQNYYDFCKEEVEELKAAFKIFEEENGKINPENIKKCLKSWICQRQSYDYGVIKELNYYV